MKGKGFKKHRRLDQLLPGGSKKLTVQNVNESLLLSLNSLTANESLNSDAEKPDEKWLENWLLSNRTAQFQDTGSAKSDQSSKKISQKSSRASSSYYRPIDDRLESDSDENTEYADPYIRDVYLISICILKAFSNTFFLMYFHLYFEDFLKKCFYLYLYFLIEKNSFSLLNFKVQYTVFPYWKKTAIFNTNIFYFKKICFYS